MSILKSKPLKSEKDRVHKDSGHLWKPLVRKIPTLEEPKIVKKIALPVLQKKQSS
jgi:hypothetical protein